MIIITGTNRGLGKAIAERLINKGEKVIGLVRSNKNLDINIDTIYADKCVDRQFLPVVLDHSATGYTLQF